MKVVTEHMEAPSGFSDRIIERTGTDCVKWDMRSRRFGTNEVLPFWVADSDLPSCPEIVEALARRAQHPFYGYTHASERLYQAMAAWTFRRTGWQIDPDWIVLTPGVVCGMSLALMSFSVPNDTVLVQPPVYPPFFAMTKSQGRHLEYNLLRLRDGRYEPDLEDLEAKARRGAKCLMLCSPHNPVGRVWDRSELEGISRICLEHELFLISDEIHCDLLRSEHSHVPTASLSSVVEQRTVTCISPSKSFNIPGLQLAGIIIPDSKHRRRFQKTLERAGIRIENPFSLAAAEAAYTKGERWLADFNAYIDGNFCLIRDFLGSTGLPVSLIEPQSTYLAWLDFRSLGLPDSEISRRLVHECCLGLDDGPRFGPGGEGFQRMNLACPRALLEEGLSRLLALTPVHRTSSR